MVCAGHLTVSFRAGASDPVQSLICLLTSLLKSFPRLLLKSGVGPLARYGDHQEIISRRLKQLYTSPDTRLEWPGEGPLFELDSNKRWGQKPGHYSSHPRPSLKLGLQPLGRFDTHQETINKRPESHLTQDWNGVGRDHYSSRTGLNTGGPKCSHCLSHFLDHS